MSTTILSFQNRVVIETLHNEGRSLRYIANYLGFSKATIFNELHRLNSEYRAELAQADFERKVSQRGRKSSLTKNLKHLIEEKIQVQKWSPEQVAHVVGIAYKTVYNWIDQGWLDVQLPDLPDHGIRRHRAKEKRGTFSHGHLNVLIGIHQSRSSCLIYVINSFKLFLAICHTSIAPCPYRWQNYQSHGQTPQSQ